MGGASAVLSRQRAIGAAALAGTLLAYYAFHESLLDVSTWWDVGFLALVLIPAVFGLVWLALPLRRARGLLAIGLALAALAFLLEVGDLQLPANLAKLAAMTVLAFWFLGYFEHLSWVVLVAVIVPLVDAYSVWRGPTHHIVTERREIFSALSFAFPIPGEDAAANLGLPDLLFFGLFLAAAARWSLRVGWTWAALVASFGATMALAVWGDPFGIGGLPALPLLSIGFLLVNADLIWRYLRRGLPLEHPE
ncbi:MAG: hypothetical protein ABR521_01265 [Gaiellaceae bacterium]